MAKTARKAAANDIIEPSKSELTRQRILDAAALVFSQRGYGHSRLSDVAKQADSHAGGIYYYFPSREALVEELLRICTTRSLDDLRAALDALPPDAGAKAQLFAAARSQLTGIMSNDPYVLAYNRIYAQVPEEVRQRHQSILRQYFELWRKIIRTGQAAGEIRDDIDAAVLRLTITGAIQWAAEWASATQGSVDNLAQQMTEIFFRGALTEKGKE